MQDQRATGSFAFGDAPPYRPANGGFDEMVDATGRIRPHWQGLIGDLKALGPEAFYRRTAEARRTLHRNGVSYNVYAAADRESRLWALDLMPFVLDAAEWDEIRDGVIQRARLCNLILADLYGPRSAIAKGLLPATAIAGNPNFLTACAGITPPHGQWVQFFSADLARGPDGDWVVVGDRTQAPSGIGYAMENRQVVAGSLNEAYRAARAAPLSGFAGLLRQGLAGLSADVRDPRIVLLTPGPYNETYFEHAYLARHLGLVLVEGKDLTVRDCRVYLKTLAGLEPVHVILRRMDDSYCDPLALRSESWLGIPGLVEACRAGSVVMANALGSGLLGAPLFQSYMDRLSQHFLGENLRLRSMRTLWAGDPSMRAELLDRLDQMVILGADAPNWAGMVFPETLDDATIDDWRGRILSRPDAYVAQERLMLSTTPVWTGGALEPRPTMLRVHVFGGADGYAVMPGGLTRVAPDSDAHRVTMQLGGISKDTWVLGVPGEMADEPKPPEPETLPVVRTTLTSRVADNLYWYGRYAERAEAVVRLFGGVLQHLAAETTSGNRDELTALAGLMIRFGHLAPGDENALALHAAVLQGLTMSRRPGDLPELLTEIRRLAGAVRDRLSGDTWRLLNRIEETRAQAIGNAGDATRLLDSLIAAFAGLKGLEVDSMRRGLGWRFLDLGRRLERATTTTGLLISLFDGPPEIVPAGLDVVLEVVDSDISYHALHLRSPQMTSAIGMLVSDASNPRAVAFQIDRIAANLEALPHARHAAWRSALYRLREASGAARETARTPERLASLLRGVLADLGDINEAVTNQYLRHDTARPVALMAPVDHAH